MNALFEWRNPIIFRRQSRLVRSVVAAAMGLGAAACWWQLSLPLFPEPTVVGAVAYVFTGLVLLAAPPLALGVPPTLVAVGGLVAFVVFHRIADALRV